MKYGKFRSLEEQERDFFQIEQPVQSALATANEKLLGPSYPPNKRIAKEIAKDILFMGIKAGRFSPALRDSLRDYFVTFDMWYGN